MENYDDWTQDARRGSSDLDNLGNVRTCAGRDLRTGSFPDRDVLNGGALTPAGRMGLELPGGASTANNAYAAMGSASLSLGAQRYRSYDPATGRRRHSSR